MTNRELYQEIEGVVERHKAGGRTLEEYLSALLVLARQQSNLDSLPVEVFVRLLTDAFTVDTSSFDEGWRTPVAASAAGFGGLEATLIRQLVDLRDMDESGDLKKELRYFGLKAPRGSYWFNFDPASFLECGVTGTFGGWEQESSTKRADVTGQVAALDSDGRIVLSNPEDIIDPVIEIAEVSWVQFRDFVLSGQEYE